MYRYKLFILIIGLMILSSCNRKEERNNQQTNNNGEFSWRETVSVNDIPETPVKGKIDGKDFLPVYINFEQWRGSNDNVFNFSDKSPRNNCGFIENDNGFQITKIGSDFSEGEFVKDSFLKNLEGYNADFHIAINDDMKKITSGWNLALVITEMNDNVVKGKIAMCFKDEKKSWIAGKFEATRCNN